MEKSIEGIWKEGFLKGDALVAPRLNSLYNQKSKHIVDHFMSVAKKNMMGIIIGAIIFLALSIIFKTMIAGIILFLILMGLAFYQRKLIERMQRTDQGLNAYEYIKAVDLWLKDCISTLTRIYRVLYPAIVIAFSLGLWHSSFGRMMLEHTSLKNQADLMILGVPRYSLLGTVVIAGLASVFAGPLFRLDIRLVYGRIFAKLEDLLADMEELRQG